MSLITGNARRNWTSGPKWTTWSSCEDSFFPLFFCVSQFDHLLNIKCLLFQGTPGVKGAKGATVSKTVALKIF